MFDFDRLYGNFSNIIDADARAIVRLLGHARAWPGPGHNITLTHPTALRSLHSS